MGGIIIEVETVFLRPSAVGILK